MWVESTRMRFESTRMRVVKKYNNNKKKAKHGAGAYRSKVNVYYDEYKVIFLMLPVGLELRIPGLQHVLCPPSYALGYCVELNMKKKYQSY
jgi:hypothetical protein